METKIKNPCNECRKKILSYKPIWYKEVRILKMTDDIFMERCLACDLILIWEKKWKIYKSVYGFQFKQILPSASSEYIIWKLK